MMWHNLLILENVFEVLIKTLSDTAAKVHILHNTPSEHRLTCPMPHFSINIVIKRNACVPTKFFWNASKDTVIS